MSETPMSQAPQPPAPKPLKATLNLPQTDFPMKAGLPVNEPLRLKKWEEEDLYGQIRAARAGGPRYILHDGPPYANGAIHLGHALNKCLKDFVVKTKTMAGFDAPYVPGWDCHGLPIEIKVDEQLGRKKLDMDPVAVRRACREYAQKYLDLQRSQFIRMGIFGRWAEPYATMDPAYEAHIAETFFYFFEQGFVYKGLKPVFWCIHDRTALAEAEVEYEQHTSPSIYVRYALRSNAKLIDPAFAVTSSPAKASGERHGILDAVAKFVAGSTPEGEATLLTGNEDAANPVVLPDATHESFSTASAAVDSSQVYTIIWTTTPWTIPASQAVAFNPELVYVALACTTGIYVIAEALLPSVVAACKLKSAAAPEDAAGLADVLVRIPGNRLEGTTYQHPFLEREIVGVTADYVTADQGTGAVHTSPAHGVDDFATGKRYGLPDIQFVDDAGRQMHTGEQPYEGLTVFKSNAPIIEVLREHGALLSAISFEHSYPHCWRCHHPVIVRATEQWFIDMETPMVGPDGGGARFRQRALAEIDRVTWDPAWGKERITNMVATRPDWCISRQRIWGVPIAIFLCRKCSEPLRDAAINKSVVELFVRESADAWYVHSAEEMLPSGTTCKACGHGEFRKEMDILDVWFESGASSHAVMDFDADTQQAAGDPDRRADLYAEGGDQHRGWFMSSLLCNIGMHNSAPFKSVATYGWTLDEKGRALSKSLGNFIDPVLVMDQLGGDIVRLWVASVDFREDVVASLPLLKRLAEEIYRKLRNTFRFMLGNLHDFDPSTDMVKDFAKLEPLDQYMLVRMADVTEKIKAAYAAFEFHRVYHLLNEFCNSDLSALYLDVLKDRLYTFAPNAAGRRSAQTVIYRITDALARLTAPILSFTAEEVWGALPKVAGRAQSVHLTLFPDAEEFQVSGETRLTDDWKELILKRTEVLAKLEGLRAAKTIGKSLEAVVTLHVQGSGPDGKLIQYASALAELFNVSEVDFLAATPGDSGDLPRMSVRQSERPKCERCWRHVPDVAAEGKYPTVCLRCAEALGALAFPPYSASTAEGQA